MRELGGSAVEGDYGITEWTNPETLPYDRNWDDYDRATYNAWKSWVKIQLDSLCFTSSCYDSGFDDFIDVPTNTVQICAYYTYASNTSLSIVYYCYALP